MNTNFPNQVKHTVNRMMRKFGPSELYYVGGCLQDRDTQDYDVIVYTDEHPDEITELMDNMFPGIIDQHLVYADDQSNPYIHICSVKQYGYKIDFLFVTWTKNIFTTMSQFPLSVQMLALPCAEPIESELIIGEYYSANPIIVYYPGKAETKYRGYFPDTVFVNPDGSIRRVFNEPPF